MRAILIAAIMIVTATTASAETPMQVTRGINGEPVLAVDIFRAMANERVKESAFLAKPFIALAEAGKETAIYARERPGRFTLATIGTYAASSRSRFRSFSVTVPA